MLAVGRDDSPPHFVVDDDLGHVFHIDRHAVLGDDLHVFEFLDAGRAADAVHQQHVAFAVDVAAADVEVVPAKGVDHILKGDVVFVQERGIDADLILFLESAPGVDLGGSGNGPELRADGPVLQRADFRPAFRFGIFGSKEQVMKHLTQAGGHRSEFRTRRARWQFELGQSLADQLPDEIQIGPVVKGHRDLGDAELRDGADLDKAGQSAHQKFDRISNQPFDFRGDHAGNVRVDLHLYWGRVGKGIDVQSPERNEPRHRDDDRSEKYEPAMIQ